MIEFFCSYELKSSSFRSKLPYGDAGILAKAKQFTAKNVLKKNSYYSTKHLLSHNLREGRLSLQRSGACSVNRFAAKKKSSVFFSSKSIAFFLYFFNLGSFVTHYSFLFFRGYFSVAGFYFFSFLRALCKSFLLVKYVKKFGQRRHFANLKMRLLRVFKAYLLRRFFAKWSLFNFVKNSRRFKNVAKRNFLIWLYRHVNGPSIKDLKWRFFFKLVNKKRFFKYVFFSRRFLTFVRHRKVLFFLFKCIMNPWYFLKIKLFHKACSLPFFQGKFLMKFFFHKFRSNTSFLRRKKEAIFGKRVVFFKRRANSKVRKDLKSCQNFVYYNYKGRRRRRQRGYLLRRAKGLFSKRLLFIKSLYAKKESLLKKTLRSFSAHKIIVRRCFLGFYSFYFFSFFKLVFEEFKFSSLFFSSKISRLFLGHFRLFLCRVFFFFFFFIYRAQWFHPLWRNFFIRFFFFFRLSFFAIKYFFSFIFRANVFFYGFFKKVIPKNFRRVVRRVFFLRRYFTAAFRRGYFFGAGRALIGIYHFEKAGIPRRSAVLPKSKRGIAGVVKKLSFKKPFVLIREPFGVFKRRSLKTKKQYAYGMSKQDLIFYSRFDFCEDFFIPKGLRQRYSRRFFSFYFNHKKLIYEKNLMKFSFADVADFFVGKGYFLGKVCFFSFYGRLFFKGWHFNFIKAILSLEHFTDNFLRRLFFRRSRVPFVPFKLRSNFLFNKPSYVYGRFGHLLRNNSLKRSL